MKQEQFPDKLGMSVRTLQRWNKFIEAEKFVSESAIDGFEEFIADNWNELNLSQKNIIDLSKLDSEKIRHVSCEIIFTK